MPHLQLQYSGNLTQEMNFADLFPRMHQVLVDAIGVRPDQCKSRAMKLEDFCIGDGDPEDAFVHLDVRIFEGRPDEQKKEIGRQFMDILREFYSAPIPNNRVQITMEILEIKRDYYWRDENVS